MILLGRMAISDRSGLTWDEFSLEAQLTDQGDVVLLLEQGIEAGEPWGNTVTLMPTMSLGDLRKLRDLLGSVILSAEGCLEVARKGKCERGDSNPHGLTAARF
jgi:hypothetical protein